VQAQAVQPVVLQVMLGVKQTNVVEIINLLPHLHLSLLKEILS
jgi:hypothetical protein